MDSDYPEKLLGKADNELFQILLAHNPAYFDNYVTWGADLSLAGHVHGGIVRIPFWNKGVLSPSIQFFPKYDGGIFKQDNKTCSLQFLFGYLTLQNCG